MFFVRRITAGRSMKKQEGIRRNMKGKYIGKSRYKTILIVLLCLKCVANKIK